MKVLVGIKRVIDYAIKIRVKPDNTGVEMNNVKMSMNPFDEIAIEEAIRLKEKKIVSQITSLSIGPKQASEVLRTSLALGSDKAIHVLTDLRIDQKIQPLMVAKILKYFFERDKYDLILLGKQSIDDDFNQTGQLLAGLLRIPQATNISKLNIKDKTAEITREIDGGLQMINFKLPAVITCDLRLNQPRFATLPNIMKAKQKPLEEIKLDSLGINLENKLDILKIENPPTRQGGVKVETVDELIAKLKSEAKVI